MFTARQIELAQRKARLLERIEMQRGQIAVHAGVLKIPLGVADKALQAMRYVKANPWMAGVAMFVAVILGRRNLLRWAGRGLTVWRGWRFVQGWLRQQGLIKT